MREVVIYLRERYPEAKLMSIGFSMGANMMVKYLGERGSESQVDAAVSISNAFDFVKLVASLHNPANEFLYVSYNPNHHDNPDHVIFTHFMTLIT